MTSEASVTHSCAYVWVWLPNASEPVVAGILQKDGQQLVFNYGRSYLARTDAISLYAPEQPLQTGKITLISGLSMPSSLRDASPDAWGRHVIANRKLGKKVTHSANVELDELTYLLESGSDRIGALDFQLSPLIYLSRQAQQPALEELLTAAEMVDRGIPLTAELDQALLHGTSLGGARPKVLINDQGRKFIAKFSSSTDLYSVVKAEYIAMRLAHKLGLYVAGVQLRSALGKDVLLIERFDRVWQEDHWLRRPMVSALTIFELDEMMAAYASYEKLAEIIRYRFSDPKNTLQELFSRMVFNVLCGNTDDHARNHAAFWDGYQLSLTPAYDICPQARTGQTASQAMFIHGSDRSSQLATCLSAANTFMLSTQEAVVIINDQVVTIQKEWNETCDEANLSLMDRNLLWHPELCSSHTKLFQN